MIVGVIVWADQPAGAAVHNLRHAYRGHDGLVTCRVIHVAFTIVAGNRGKREDWAYHQSGLGWGSERIEAFGIWPDLSDFAGNG